MLHELKIKQCYLIHILEGRKTFEVRKNDRDFQVNDMIHFLPLEDENYAVHSLFPHLPAYRITYVLADFGGLQHEYVVLGIAAVLSTED